jgi:trimeric autotransporter adhesin
MPSLEQVLGPVRAVPPSDRAFAGRMLLKLERCLASAAAALHPAVRPNAAKETLADQDRLLATWLAAYYSGVSATPEVLRGDLLEPLVARSGCAEPFCGPAAGGGADDDGSRLRFGLPSKSDARCDTRTELLRAAAAAIIALHSYLNYPRRGKDSLPPDETVVALSTLVIRSLAPPPAASAAASATPRSSSSSSASSATRDEADAQRRQKEHSKAMDKLDAELADLGMLPSSRALLAAAGFRLRTAGPAAAAAASAAENEEEEDKAAGAKAAAEAGAAADAEAEAADAADAAAAEAADAARDGEEQPPDASSSSSSPLPGVPPLAPGASAASRLQLEALPPLRTSHVRWLMHWARGRVLATMADVSLAVQEQEQQEQEEQGGALPSAGNDGTRRATMLLAAAQRDALGMASSLPAHPSAYSLFAALAMRGQQFQAAVPFLRRGLAVARACRDDAAQARMCFQLAAALLLGGGGVSPTDPSKPQPVSLADVLALCDAGDAAAEQCAAWWPHGAFGPCPGDGEPERSVVWQKLLPAVAAREGVAASAAFAAPTEEGGGDNEEAEAAAAALARFLAETEAIEPLQGLAWVSPPPRAVPPGAVLVEEGGEEEGALGVVVEEGGEETGAPPAAAASTKTKKKKPAAAAAAKAAATAAPTKK